MENVMTTIGITAFGMVSSWCIWVSVSIFKLSEEIAIMRQELKVLIEVKDLLGDIRMELHDKRSL